MKISKPKRGWLDLSKMYHTSYRLPSEVARAIGAQAELAGTSFSAAVTQVLEDFAEKQRLAPAKLGPLTDWITKPPKSKSKKAPARASGDVARKAKEAARSKARREKARIMRSAEPAKKEASASA